MVVCPSKKLGRKPIANALSLAPRNPFSTELVLERGHYAGRPVFDLLPGGPWAVQRRSAGGVEAFSQPYKSKTSFYWRWSYKPILKA